MKYILTVDLEAEDLSEALEICANLPANFLPDNRWLAIQRYELFETGTERSVVMTQSGRDPWDY